MSGKFLHSLRTHGERQLHVPENRGHEPCGPDNCRGHMEGSTVKAWCATPGVPKAVADVPTLLPPIADFAGGSGFH